MHVNARYTSSKVIIPKSCSKSCLRCLFLIGFKQGLMRSLRYNAGFWGMFHKASYQRNWLKYYILFFAGSTKKFLFLKNNCYKLLNFEVRFLLKKSKQFIQNCYESSPYFINNSKKLYIKRSNLACSTY